MISCSIAELYYFLGACYFHFQGRKIGAAVSSETLIPLYDNPEDCNLNIHYPENLEI
jgi:hypothetical protein